jgi:hypothetical protein
MLVSGRCGSTLQSPVAPVVPAPFRTRCLDYSLVTASAHPREGTAGHKLP